jgi:UDP-glucose 4-epimerase
VDKTILITGGAGYVGSHTNKYLSELGYKTVVLDNLERGHKELIKWGEFVEGNVGDTLLLKELFGSYKFDAIVHFAAYAYVQESVLQPEEYWRNNVGNTLSLLESTIEHGVKKFILSSTCATYGIPTEIPILESHQQNPVSPYGASKLAVELLLKDFAATYDVDYFILRYFNAAGADPDGDIGEKHIPETHLIPKLLIGVLEENPTISLYGVDYPTRDGTCVRDYVHVTDLADAHYRALHYLLEHRERHCVCNLGLGRGFSVREVVSSVERITGRRVRVNEAQRRAGDVPELIADATVAKNLLKWSPRFKTLDEIVGTAWDWHRNN